jgi:hypothetical protein
VTSSGSNATPLGEAPSSRTFRALALVVVALFFASLAGVSVQKSFDVSSGAGTGGTGESLRSSSGIVEGSAGDIAGTGADAGGGSAADGTGGPASGTTAGSTGNKAGSVAGGSSASPGARASTGAKGAVAPLVVGIHDSDPGAAFTQYGVKGGPTGDQGPWIKEVADWINTHGGMGGRKLELVTHVTEALNGSFDQQAEEACVDFTEDHHVAIVVGGALVPTLNLADCLARHQTPLVWSYDYMVDRATFQRYANYLYMPSMVEAERLGSWMDAVADGGFFANGKVGIVRYDEPTQKHLSDDVLKPRMAARGVTVTDEAAFRGATGASSAADLSAQANSTILRFQSEGIDRVVLQPTAAVLPLLFFVAAEAQHYHPRYTFTSYDVPAFQADNAKNNTQLVGSMAYGWIPAGDVAYAQSPPLNPTAKRCVDITPDADPKGNGSIRRYCDGLMFLKALFDRGADPSVAGIRRAVDALGTSYESAWTFSTNMSSQRHDGATVARLVEFDTGCSCYRYTGPSRLIP